MAGKHEKSTSCGFRTSIGGQALIEGILMRGPKKQAIVCRTEEGLTEKVEDLHLLREKYPFFGWPLVRGCVTFIDSMVKGMKALTYSADLLPEDEYYIRANKDNIASQKTVLKNGGYIHHTDKDKVYMRIRK